MVVTDAEITVKIAENRTWKGKHPILTMLTPV